MPKRATKFSAKLQQDYPFLKAVPESPSDVVCLLCLGKFSIANSGRPKVLQHLDTQKHIRATKAAISNQTMDTFLQKPEDCSDRKPEVEYQSAALQTSGSTEIDEQVDFKVEDLVQNCHFCFKSFNDNRKPVKITEKIEHQFLELTQCLLLQDDGFSKLICISCRNKLGVSFTFRRTLLENQRKFYEALSRRNVSDVKQEFQNVVIKTEKLDEYIPEAVFMDCPALEFEEESPQKMVRGPYKKSKKVAELNVHARRKRFKCDLCSHEFFRRSHLLLHLETEHHKIRPETKVEPNNKLTPKTPCELCGALVYDQKIHNLKVHLRVRNFFCDICPFSAFQKHGLEKHMRRHLNKNPDKYFCEVCGKEFQKRAILNAHIRKRHTAREKTHQCTVCLKFFLTVGILEKHAEQHSARDMPCEFCGKLFTCKNNLRKHLYLHGPPRFTCDFPNCDKKFQVIELLRFHRKSHRGDKDFVCELCERCYYSQSDLNRHKFSYHEKLRFFCKLPGCNGDFGRRGYYRKHVLAVHKNLEADDFARLLEDVEVAVPSRK